MQECAVGAYAERRVKTQVISFGLELEAVMVGVGRTGETEYGGVGGLMQPRAKGHRTDADNRGVKEEAMLLRIMGRREAAGLPYLDRGALLDRIEAGKDPMS